MWKKMDSLASPKSGFTRLNVVGAPGTGKSMVAWAWTCFTALSTPRKNIIWVHLNKADNKISLCHFDKGKIKTFEKGSQMFEKTIRDVNADLMVIDGVTNKDYDLFTSASTEWRLNSERRRVAIIMSASVVLSSQQQKQAQLEEWHMPSWTLDNYEAACANPEFYNQVKKFLPKGYDQIKDQLASKFFMAGSSARWMFSFKYEELEDEIKKQLGRVENKEWILSDISGNNCERAVGHLRFEDKNKGVFFVSQYVMIQVAKKCELQFIKDAYTFIAKHRNPAFKGWIVEFDFLGQLHQALRHKTKVVVRKDKQELHLPVTVIKYINTDGAGPSFLQNLKKRPGLWLIPTRWNQGGYDAVYIDNNNTVNFVQITISGRHDLKLQYMQNLFTQLCPPKRRRSRRLNPSQTADARADDTSWRPDIWFIVPLGKECKPKKVYGQLSGWDEAVKNVEFRLSGPSASHATEGNNNNNHYSHAKKVLKLKSDYNMHVLSKYNVNIIFFKDHFIHILFDSEVRFSKNYIFNEHEFFPPCSTACSIM